MVGRLAMWLFVIAAVSSKIEVPLDVKFTAACTLTPEVMMSVDNGAFSLKPALRGSTYVRLHPGEHHIIVTHPWCTFYPVHLTLEHDGSFVAVVNETSTTEYPIKIRHQANVDKESLTGMFSTNQIITFAVVVIGFQLFKAWMSNPNNQDRVRQYQEDMQRRLEEAQKQK